MRPLGSALFFSVLFAFLPTSNAGSTGIEYFYTKYYASGATCVVKNVYCGATCKESYQVCPGECPWDQLPQECGTTLVRPGPDEGFVFGCFGD